VFARLFYELLHSVLSCSDDQGDQKLIA